MAKVNKIMPPRNTTIRGQDHLLAYITPEEAQLLIANGGAGKAVGPHKIPAFFDVGEGWGGYDSTEDRGGVKAAETAGGRGDPDAGVALGDSYSDDSAGYDYSDFYQETPSQYGGASDYSLVGDAPAVNQYDTTVEQLMQLNKDLQNLSRREKIAVDRLNSPMSMLPFVGLGNYLGVQNVRNLAGAMGGNPPGFFSSLGFGDRNANKFGGLDPSALAALQSNVLRDKAGNPVGFTDEYGNVQYGTDPNADYGGRDGYEEVKPVDPETGQCEDGYIFDAQLNACRLDTGTATASAPTVAAPTTGGYAQMGLLDQAPTGLPQFQQQYGAGFGSPSQFAAANTDFRRRGAVMPAYPGYTLLS